MNAVKCPNCRLSLPPNWAGVNDPNGKCPYCGKPLAAGTQPAAAQPASTTPAPVQPTTAAAPVTSPAPKVQSAASKTILWGVGAPMPAIIKPPAPVPPKERTPVVIAQTPARSTGANPAVTPTPSPISPHAVAGAPRVTTTKPTDGFAATVEISALKRENLLARTPAPQPQPLPQRQPDPVIEVDVAMDAVPTKPEPGAPVNSAAKADSAAPALAVLAASQELSLSDVVQDKSTSVENGQPAATPVQASAIASSTKEETVRTGPKLSSSRPTSAPDDLEDQPKQSKKGLVIGLVLLAAAASGVAFLVLGRSRGGEATKPMVEEKTVAAKPLAPPEPVAAAPKAVVPAAEAKPTPAPTAKPAKPIAEAKPAPEPKPAKPVAEAKPAPAPTPKTAKPIAEAKPAPTPTAKPAKPVAEAKPTPTPKPAATENAKPTGKGNEEKAQQAADAYKRGNANLFQGKLAEAIADFNEALKLNPKDPSPHRGLGLALGQQGKSPEAIKHLKLYLKASPKAQDRQTIEKRIEMLSAK